jgi:hypothetical protein
LPIYGILWTLESRRCKDAFPSPRYPLPETVIDHTMPADLAPSCLQYSNSPLAVPARITRQSNKSGGGFTGLQVHRSTLQIHIRRSTGNVQRVLCTQKGRYSALMSTGVETRQAIEITLKDTGVTLGCVCRCSRSDASLLIQGPE